MGLFTLASSVGLSVPLTVLAMGLLHHAGSAPAFVELAVRRHPALASPVVLGLAAFLFLFEVLTAKTKLTKPVKAVSDLVQVVVKPLATAMLGLALLDVRFAAEPQVAGLAGGLARLASVDLPAVGRVAWPAIGWFELALAVAVTLLVHLVRSGADLVVWLSPVPFIDAVVSGLADAYTVAMIAIAFVFPRAAAVLCALQIVACVLLAFWMARAAVRAVRMLVST